MGGSNSTFESTELPQLGKILLLGAASTGKSTFLRQAQSCKRAESTRRPIFSCVSNLLRSADGMSTQKKQEYARDMRWNAVNGMRNILASSDHLRDYRDILFTAITSPSLPRTELEAQLVCLRTVLELWHNPIVKNAIENPQYSSSLGVLTTGVEQRLFELLPLMVNERWLPSAADAALVRSPTAQILCDKLVLGADPEWQVVQTWDVGGGREDRKRWWKDCLDENFDALLFFLAPGAIDEMLTEHPQTLKLAEDFQLWTEVSQFPEFQHTKVFVILNKMDRFPFSNLDYFTVSQLREQWDELPVPLLSLVREYTAPSDFFHISRLEQCFQGKYHLDETPISFIRRRVLDLRPDVVVVECDSTDLACVKRVVRVIEKHLLEPT